MPNSTKQRLIDIAYDLFREKDASEIGVREICAEAGVTTGAFYHHFRDKYDVLSAKLDGHDEKYRSFLSLPFDGTGLRRIQYFLSDYMTGVIYEDGIRITRIVFMTNSLNKKGSGVLPEVLNILLEEAAASGEIRDGIDIRHYSLLLVKAFRGTVYYWARSSAPFDLRAELREVTGIYLSYISAGPWQAAPD